MLELTKYLKGDRAIWLLMLFLALVSTLLVYSAVVTLAYKYHEGNSMVYLLKHLVFLVMGFGIIYMIHKVKYSYFSRIAQIALGFAIILLILTPLIGVSANTAGRWLQIPVINQTFQTSDFAKLALIMYVARALSIKKEVLADLKKGFLPMIIPVFIVCGLILRENLSTAAALFTSCFVLMYVGQAPLKYLGATIGIMLVTLSMVFLIGSVAPDAFPRLETWKNRVINFSEDENPYYDQAELAKYSIATGELLGKGPGNSTQKSILPQASSDFIYAILIEEYGSIGGAGLVFLYLLLLVRSLRIISRCDKNFGALLVVGISFSLVFQAMIHMAVSANLIPVTGQPLPMVSRGGTSIWFTCISIGIILSVSRTFGGEEDAKNKEVKYETA